MRVYGVERPTSDFKVTYGDREFALLGCDCTHCDYVWFVPAVSEHEPSYCPNCGIKIVGVFPTESVT